MNLEELKYPQFKETLYRTKLSNGLTVNLMPRQGFHKTYAVMTTNYGSLDNSYFDQAGNLQMIPAGTAHFLEHKLFEKQDHDAFDLFGEYGADANAFTSFTKTSFLFSTTANLEACLQTLLDFVQESYFSARTVEKEKGIIGEEISMYDDDTDWQLFFGMLRNLYPKDPVSVDIAGTKETLTHINAQLLEDCYRQYYQPANMDLFVVGGFDLTRISNAIEENQRTKTFIPPVLPLELNRYLNQTGTQIVKFAEKQMNVSRPKSMLGIKGMQPLPSGRAGLRYKLELELGLYLLFGESSVLFQKLYQAGVVDDSFNYELEMERGFYFAVVSGDTFSYEEMERQVKETISQAPQILAASENELALAKKEFLGQYIQAQNSLESIANGYEGQLFDNATVFDYALEVQQLSLADVSAAVEQLFEPQMNSIFRILPQRV